MLKKLLILFALMLSVALSFGIAADARAQTAGWVRVVDSAMLYSSDDGKKQVCLLERSYYLQVLDQTDSMYFVMVTPCDEDFPNITGYVHKASVTPCTVPPLEPYYPAEKISVTSGAAALQLSPTISSDAVVSAMNTQKLLYYGAITNNGVTWYYVYFAKQFGYVDSSLVTKPNVPLHPTPLPQKPVTAEPSEQPTEPVEESKAPASEILLIVFVVLLAVGLTLAIFLPGNLRKKSNVFEQDI